MSNPASRVEYRYQNVPIPGGGFVTGFVFHPVQKEILYCRTDIGGTYRYDFRAKTWVSLTDHATDPGVWETYPLSLALDANNPGFLYTMVGLFPVHKIGFSEDRGENWVYFDSPVIDDQGNTATFHGNGPGRSTGERLVVDPHNSDILYLGTPKDGLWKTEDRCRTWRRLCVAAPGKASETNIAFVEIDPSSPVRRGASSRLVVATNGRVGSPDGTIRGQSVYISDDSGESFSPLVGEPVPVLGGAADHPGYVGQRAVFVGPYLLISYAAYNVGWSNWDMYGCDTGKCYDGALFRFHLGDHGQVLEALDVTPPVWNGVEFHDPQAPGRRRGYGFSGLGSDPNHPGTLICSTITANPDAIFRSTDYGLSWKPIMAGLEIGRINFTVPYQKPEHNGQGSLVHWMSDLKINPFDSDMAVFNTGAGIFMTRNLTAADRGEPVVWECFDDGVEETVHLNVYSPPSGEAKVIDIIGDYGGFIFTDLDRPAENTIANRNKDRWITGMNADFPDANPQRIVIAPRGNWTRKTQGGLIITQDQGRHWDQLPPPRGLTADLDANVDRIVHTANVTAGWTAITADGETIVWGLGLPLFTHRHVYTRDQGKHWAQCQIFDRAGRELSHEAIPFKVLSDRVNPRLLYGFSDHQDGGGFFVSTDGGASFHQKNLPMGFPQVDLAGIDSEQIYEIRVEPGREGVIYLALLQAGLWKVCFDSSAGVFSGGRVSQPGDSIKRIGFGKPRNDAEEKTFFTSGTIQGGYGFFRSHDGGRHWIRINDDKHQFGDIRSISGDPRVFGRIYVATGTRGLVYGDPVLG